MAFWLSRRTPALPAWFVAGTVGLYTSVEFREDSIAIPPAQWVSAEETQELRRNPERPRIILPMRELLERLRPEQEGDSDALAQVWRSQCTLFVRRAVAHRDGARKDALWEFAARSVHEPVTEENAIAIWSPSSG